MVEIIEARIRRQIALRSMPMVTEQAQMIAYIEGRSVIYPNSPRLTGLNSHPINAGG
jgi:hypothetical protein